MYRRYIKRIMDFILSMAALAVLSPVLFFVGLLVRISLGNPVIFRHRRPGKDGKIFTLYKFRTMTDERDAGGVLLPDTVRLTKLGRILRAASLDELPELVNILKGDMSIVGPRPLEEYFLPYYTEEEMHRHDVRPGLTGLAQVSGRNNLTWEQRFAYDLAYISSISFGTDMKLILQTASKVFKADGTDIPTEDFNVCREKERNQGVSGTPGF